MVSKKILITIITFLILIIISNIFTYRYGYKKGYNSFEFDSIYTELIPIKDTIDLPKEVLTEIPETPLLPIRPDTCWRDSIVYIVQKVDTAKIIAEYITKRDYSETLFSTDTTGILKVGWSTQYNRSFGLWYDYHPVQKTIYVKEKNELEKIRVMFGIGTKSTYSGQLQYKISDISIGYQYIRYNDDKNIHMINVGFDF